MTIPVEAEGLRDSAFAEYMSEAWPYTYEGTLHVPRIAGGTPFDERVAEGWLKSKLGDKDDLIRELVANTMAEQGITAEEATVEVDMRQHLNGFRRERCERCPPRVNGNTAFCDGEHQLFIEGRQLKAALKEAASVAIAADKLTMRGWGKTNKGLLSFLAEHVMVMDERLYLGVSAPSAMDMGRMEIIQRFVHTFRGNGIQYEEIVADAEFDFTIKTDYEFSERDWAMIWLTGEQEGIGASRAQGFGRYTLVRWEQVAGPSLASKASNGHSKARTRGSGKPARVKR